MSVFPFHLLPEYIEPVKHGYACKECPFRCTTFNGALYHTKHIPRAE